MDATSIRDVLIILLVSVFTAVVVVYARWMRRRTAARGNSLAGWLSSLGALGKQLSNDRAPTQMLEAALAGMKTFGARKGYALLLGDREGARPEVSAKGLSARTVETFGSEPMLTYLASAAERWGSLLDISDPFGSEAQAADQGNLLLQTFISLMKAEGVGAVLVIGLTTAERNYGVLIIGLRKTGASFPEDLKLPMAIGKQAGVALENWSLNRAAEKHQEQLQLLYSLDRALRETFDLNEQASILRHTMKDLLTDNDFSLAIQEFPGGPLAVAVPFLQKDAELSATEARTLGEHVLSTLGPLLICEDWQWGPYRCGSGRNGSQMRTWCGVPMHFSDETLGVFSVASFHRERAITKDQFELIKVLAFEAAGAFENALAFQKEQQRALHLGVLNEIGRKLNSVLNPKEILPAICSQVRDSFGHEFVRFEVMDRQRQELTVVAEAGYGNDLIGRRIRMGEGLSGAVAESGELILANSVASEPRYAAFDEGVCSALSLPLRFHDELLGTMSFESRRQNAFAPQDVLTLQALADQMANALYNARAYEHVREEAITDGLTGVKTHRYFMEALEREWRACTRSRAPFSVIMIDLDQFKPVNDKFGHLLGDHVLRTVATVLSDGLRKSAILSRYGGDEFSILMPDATAQQAEILGERLRASIEGHPFLAEHHITASLGVGSYPEHGRTHEAILHVADSGMYLAKHEHGNRVRVASLVPDFGQVEACLDVEFKRKFATGPDAFNRVLSRIDKDLENADGNITVIDTITSLARAIDCSDHYTRDHSQMVSRLAMQISRQMAMPSREAEEIRRAGILHDIGKIGIPDLILYKPARLTSAEFEIMKTHSVKGQTIVEPLRVNVMSSMVRHHHEWYDGRGYPDRLRGDQIPIGARILAVADCFDTMVSARAYKTARPLEEALAELRNCSGTQFDPGIVDVFMESLKVYGDPRVSLAPEKEEVRCVAA